MYIDIERLRKDLEDDCCGAFFAGGSGGAMIEKSQIERMSDSELVSYAQKKGINLRNYEL